MSSDKGKSTIDLNTPSLQKKRGRPRKSEAVGYLGVSQGSACAPLSVMSGVSVPPVISAVQSMPMICAAVSPPVPGVASETPRALTMSRSAANSANRSQGRGRGRRQSSGNVQMLASMNQFFADTTVTDFRVHVIHVGSGEDVIGKILSLVHNGPRGICVISASGTVSSATIFQQDSSGGLITYEDQFQILSLTGSSTVAETGGRRCRRGFFGVSLAYPNGSVIGGMAGPLLAAASGVQAVVGSFLPNANGNHRRQQQDAARPDQVGGGEANPGYQRGHA